MLTINKYNKETLDRSSITIVDRYKGIVHNKVKDINDVRNLTMMLYQTIYYYLYDAKKTLEQIAEIIDSWESETGIDTTPIRDEIKHTEAMVEAVEEITDDNYGDSDGGDNDDEIEEKAKAVESETEEVVEVIKQNPEVKEGVKEEVKEEAKTELPPSTPSAPTTPTPVPSTPEEAKENARQEAADSVRGRADDGRGDLTYEETQTPKDAVSTIIEVLTGEITATRTDTAEGAREEALDAAATVIERGGTADEATQAYVEVINASAPEGYSPTDETAQTINDDIQNIIDAANAANASSESGGGSGEDPGGGDEPGPDPGCDCGDDCDCSDSDCPDNPGCPADTGGVMENC